MQARQPGRACRARSTCGSGRPSTRVASRSSRSPRWVDLAVAGCRSPCGWERSKRREYSPGAAWRCRALAMRHSRSLAARRPCARHSAGRPRACRRSRAPRRPRSGRAARSARIRPSAAPRTRVPRPTRRRRHCSRRWADRQARVQDGDGVAEALDEAPDDLRRERDLGDQHDRALPAAPRVSAAMRR